MQLYDYVPGEVLREMVDGGYIAGKSHPTEPLTILNYTAKAQIDGVWNEATMRCRGLIFDSETFEIVARPFPKFFNYGDSLAVAVNLDQPVRVTEKVDGSLGIIYREPKSGLLSVATRGSFTSDQALHATDLLRGRYAHFTPFAGLTYLVEIVYPENRIVTDYGALDELVLLDVLHIDTGATMHSLRNTTPFRVAHEQEYKDVYEVIEHFSLVKGSQTDEGVVVLFADDTRLKFKYDEYKRLHKLLTGVSTKTIWELLSNNQPLDDLLQVVPDEFYDWVKNTATVLDAEFNYFRTRAWIEYEEAVDAAAKRTSILSPNWRKTLAEEAVKSPYRAEIFAIEDKRSIDDLCWKRVKPKYSKAFWDQSEEVA